MLNSYIFSVREGLKGIISELEKDADAKGDLKNAKLLYKVFGWFVSGYDFTVTKK